MKRTKIIYVLVLVLFFTSFSGKTYSQIEQLNYMYGPSGDARILLQEYLKPYTDIVSSNLNAAWYQTARTHKLGGIDATAMVAVAFSAPEALQFDIAQLTGLSGTVEGSDFAPTAIGTLTDRPELVYTSQVLNSSEELETKEMARYTAPDGIGKDYVPLLIAQLSVGLPFGTEITGRYAPPLNYLGTSGETSVWGIGGKHSISQWIPIIKKLKFIDIAVQGGYTNVTASSHLDLEPISALDPDDTRHWIDQYLNMNMKGWTVNLIASQTLPILTLYEGIGYASAMSEINLTGSYPVNVVISDPESDNFGETTYSPEENPIEDMLIEGYSGLRLNAGVRLKFGFFTIHYDFTRTLYSTHTAGIGFTFR